MELHFAHFWPPPLPKKRKIASRLGTSQDSEDREMVKIYPEVEFAVDIVNRFVLLVFAEMLWIELFKPSIQLKVALLRARMFYGSFMCHYVKGHFLLWMQQNPSQHMFLFEKVTNEKFESSLKRVGWLEEKKALCKMNAQL